MSKNIECLAADYDALTEKLDKAIEVLESIKHLGKETTPANGDEG